MNKYKKKSWIIVAIAVPLCLMLIIGGVISAVRFEAPFLIGLIALGIVIAVFAMGKISSLEVLSSIYEIKKESREAYCNRNGYLYIEDKKEI